nr:DMT family transporter [candidate division Zixibacteria bacterium]
MTNLLLLLTVTFWGLSFVGTKIALDYLTPPEIIALRLLLGFPVLYLVMRRKGLKISFDGRQGLIIIAASLLLGVHFVIQAIGLIYTSATNTAWLIATIPVFIAILSFFFLKERLTWKRITGILTATLGVLLLVSDGHLNNLDWLESVGDWIILGSCITWSAYTILTRNISRVINPLSLSVSILLIPMLLLTLYLIAFTPFEKLTGLPVSVILVLIFLGVFCLGIAHWFWLEGLSRKGATEVGVFLYIEPVVTTVAAGSILGEKISIFLALGAALIVFGVYLVQRKKRP